MKRGRQPAEGGCRVLAQTDLQGPAPTFRQHLEVSLDFTSATPARHCSQRVICRVVTSSQPI